MPASPDAYRPARWPSRDSSAHQIDQIIRRYAARPHAWEYHRLIAAIRSHSQLLSPRNASNSLDTVRRICHACSHLARLSQDWVCVPETWNARCPTQRRLTPWPSLLAHLLERYDTPAFISRTWLRDGQQHWQRQLHVSLGRGVSVRSMDLPVVGRLSKSVARQFMQAPDDCSVAEAVRWARLRVAGADNRLARLVMHKLPVTAESHWDECWKFVIEFLIRNQPLCAQDVGEIVDFVQQQRYEPAYRTVGRWMGPSPVDQTITLQRWSLRRLRRHMVNWKDAYAAPAGFGGDVWGTQWIGDFEAVEGDDRWTISELCSASELRMEGRRMQNCVLAYVPLCRRGSSSIWSLRRHRGESHRSVATIEINPRARKIVQFRGKANSEPTSNCLRLLRSWAAVEQLKLRV